jgi:hypothetical protein
LATKLPFCSGGITHPLRSQGLISFFLKLDQSFHEKRYQCHQARPAYQPIASETIWQNPGVDHCNSMQPNVLQNPGLPF